MTYRKTWFDYVLWAVYAGICVMLLAYVGNHIYAFYVGAPMAKLGTFLPFPILLCLYPGIRIACEDSRIPCGFCILCFRTSSAAERRASHGVYLCGRACFRAGRIL